MNISETRTMDEVLDADFRTAPTPQEVEQWRQERAVIQNSVSKLEREINLLRLALDAVLRAETLEEAKKKAVWVTE